MITEQQFVQWLKNDSAIRCVLMEVGVQVDGVETTRYLSNKGYVTGVSDTPANVSYSPVIAGGIKFTESMTLDGSASLSYGDIELNNFSGERDSWLDDVWANRPVSVYIGDVSWAREDFRKIFDGVVVGIDSRRRERINLKLGDKLQRLNTPVTEQKLGGTTANKDRLIPLCFGECHNIEPLLVDPVTLEFQVHDGPIEDIIEVRDNGVPVEFTKFLSTGKFRLNQAPVGTITCSAQGSKTDELGNTNYTNKVTGIIRRLAVSYGNVEQKFTIADLDQSQLNTFDLAHQQPVGLYLNDRANVLEVCNRLASSIGARLVMTRGGLLRLVKLDVDNVVPARTVTPSDIGQHSLNVSQMAPVVAGVKLGYCKNWTVQNNLQTGLPADHISLFAQEWLTVTKTDDGVAEKYKMFSDPAMIETLLLTETDADAEATRRLNMFKVQRKVFQYKGLLHLMLEELGAGQVLVHTRFGLSEGKSGQIISITTDWLNPHVDLEVLV